MNEYINPYDFENAVNGAIFIKKGNKLIATTFDELAKTLKAQIQGIPNLAQKEKANEKAIQDLKDYNEALARANFINVFTLFELKALKGEIDVEDEEILILDEKVLNGEISVEQAVNEFHPFIKETYNKLYGGK